MSLMLKKLILAFSVTSLMLWVMPAAAHHSAAQFDFSQRVTIDGVVKKFLVRNPHTLAIVEVTDEKGTREVEYEGHSASHFYRAGFTRDMVHEGDHIFILIAPRRDGNDGGFIQAFTVNDRTVGFAGLSPETGRRTGNSSE